MTSALVVGAATVALCACVAAGCGSRSAQSTDALTGARPDDAPALMRGFGCGACHAIPGVEGADGRVGPSLAGLGSRWTIAGRVPNTPAAVARWIRDPKTIDPRTLMPDLGVTPSQARDIAAYLERH